MKKKVIVITTIVCVVIACFALGIIIANIFGKEEVKEQDETVIEDVEQNEDKRQVIQKRK